MMFTVLCLCGSWQELQPVWTQVLGDARISPLPNAFPRMRLYPQHLQTSSVILYQAIDMLSLQQTGSLGGRWAGVVTTTNECGGPVVVVTFHVALIATALVTLETLVTIYIAVLLGYAMSITISFKLWAAHQESSSTVSLTREHHSPATFLSHRFSIMVPVTKCAVTTHPITDICPRSLLTGHLEQLHHFLLFLIYFTSPTILL